MNYKCSQDLQKLLSTANPELFLLSVEYKPEFTSWDLRNSIEPKDLPVARIFSLVVSLAGTNLDKIEKRVPEDFKPIIKDLKTYANRYSTVKGKKVGKGKLSAAFPEAELSGVCIASSKREAFYTSRCVAYHYSSRTVKDITGAEVPKGLESYIAGSLKFVETITRKQLTDREKDDRSNILRAIFANFAGELVKITESQSK